MSIDKAWAPWIEIHNKARLLGMDGSSRLLYHLLKRYQDDPLISVIAAALSVAKWHPQNPMEPIAGGGADCGFCLLDIVLNSPDYDCSICPYAKRFGFCCVPADQANAYGRADPPEKVFEEIYSVYCDLYRENQELIESGIWEGWEG